MSDFKEIKINKKISRKEISQVKGMELLKLSKETYKKLFRYMKPYRGRFLLGVAMGIFAGLFNAVVLIGFQVIFAVVLSTPEERTKSEQHHAQIVQHEAAVAAAQATDASAPNGATVVQAPPQPKEFGDVRVPFLGVVNPVRWVMGYTPERATLGIVIVACAFVPILMFARGFLSYLANYCLMWVGNKVLYDLRNDTFSHILQQSLGFFNRSKVGDLIQTVFNQTRVAQQNAVQLTSVIIQKPVAILSIFILLLAWHPFFTLSSLVVFPLCLGPIAYVSRRVRKAGAAEEMEAGALMVNMHESFSGIRVVKAYGRENYEADRFDRSNKAMSSSIMRWGKALEIIGPVVETVASLGVAAGLVFAWSHHMTVSDFMLIVLALSQIYPHAKELGRVQILLQKCIVATSSVFGIIEQKPEVLDSPDAKAVKRVNGAISFQDVTFYYHDTKGRQAKKPAVSQINLEMEPGKFYALVGPSGAGKSTLFSLILRYYDPTEGTVNVDGTDIRNITQMSLRHNIGVVSQDVFLFHDTVAENIRYGRLDATDEEVIEAAKLAHAHEFIAQNKAGYENIVGDSGNNLSGGQKQRISIARAILRNAPILLLDEAYSALDTESEKIVQEAIHTLSAGKTVVAIAHRLSTILEADKIVVMDKGHILDVGTHNELLGRCVLYQRLYQLQFESGEVDPDKPVKDIKLDLDPPTDTVSEA